MTYRGIIRQVLFFSTGFSKIETNSVSTHDYTHDGGNDSGITGRGRVLPIRFHQWVSTQYIRPRIIDAVLKCILRVLQYQISRRQCGQNTEKLQFSVISVKGKWYSKC